MRKYIMVDVEADGPCPGLYSMLQLGAVVVEHGLSRQFYGELACITNDYNQSALDVIGYTREQTECLTDPVKTMLAFHTWLKSIEGNDNSVSFISDNNGFDWQFVNYYLHKFCGDNPFGWSSSNLSNVFGGMKGKIYDGGWRKYRQTKHTHNALEDAIGNAEALLVLGLIS